MRMRMMPNTSEWLAESLSSPGDCVSSAQICTGRMEALYECLASLKKRISVKSIHYEQQTWPCQHTANTREGLC